MKFDGARNTILLKNGWIRQKRRYGMKKALLGIFVSIMILSGCGYNKQLVDFDYSYKHAIIEGIGKVEIIAWNDYEDSDMI